MENTTGPEKAKRPGNSPATLERKRRRGICPAPYCSNAKAFKKAFCHKHAKRAERERDRVAAKFYWLRDSAARRGKEFTIALENFRDWSAWHGLTWAAKKGAFKNRDSVDRKNPKLGYHIWNIQPMTVSENAKKGYAEYHPAGIDQVEDLPF